jgi:hypothetical protein
VWLLLKVVAASAALLLTVAAAVSRLPSAQAGCRLLSSTVCSSRDGSKAALAAPQPPAWSILRPSAVPWHSLSAVKTLQWQSQFVTYASSVTLLTAQKAAGGYLTCHCGEGSSLLVFCTAYISRFSSCQRSEDLNRQRYSSTSTWQKREACDTIITATGH